MLSVKFVIFVQADLSNMKRQLLKDFIPDNVYPLRAELIEETSRQICSKELIEVVLLTVMHCFLLFHRSNLYLFVQILCAG